MYEVDRTEGYLRNFGYKPRVMELELELGLGLELVRDLVPALKANRPLPYWIRP
jgi:hypothetical protein